MRRDHCARRRWRDGRTAGTWPHATTDVAVHSGGILLPGWRAGRSVSARARRPGSRGVALLAAVTNTFVNAGQRGAMHATDEDLLVRLSTDPGALEEFYRRHIQKVLSFVVRRVGDPEEAADLAADVFVAVMESSDSFDPRRGRAVPWLLGVAANVSSARQRQAGRQAQVETRVRGRCLLDADDYGRLEERIDAERPARRLFKRHGQPAGGATAGPRTCGPGGADPNRDRTGIGDKPGTARMRLTRARRWLHRSLDASDLRLVAGISLRGAVDPATATPRKAGP